MISLDKIQQAKMYLDKLANGINPLDNSPVPDGDIINQVQISRCFFLVSDVLRQVIENGGINPSLQDIKLKKYRFTSHMKKEVVFAFLKSQFRSVKYPDGSMNFRMLRI